MKRQKNTETSQVKPHVSTNPRFTLDISSIKDDTSSLVNITSTGISSTSKAKPSTDTPSTNTPSSLVNDSPNELNPEVSVTIEDESDRIKTNSSTAPSRWPLVDIENQTQSFSSNGNS